MQKTSRRALYVTDYTLRPMTLRDFQKHGLPLSMWENAIKHNNECRKLHQPTIMWENVTEDHPVGPQIVTFWDPHMGMSASTDWIYPDLPLRISEKMIIVPKMLTVTETSQQIGSVCCCGDPGKYTCGRCNCQRYCSSKCQKTDWIAHSPRCNATVACQARPTWTR